ncbi:hypothetical protein ABFS82_14G165200 [Erythranthe guttata]
MEVAVIDWKNIDSRFVKDELYEHINAPKWVDFSAADEPAVDDEAWFCRPGCNHPKTVDDFFNAKQRTPISNSKLQRSASVSDIPPFGDKNKRDATLKKRGTNQTSALSNTDVKYHRIIEDGENRDPNFSTPPNPKSKFGKEAFKSSTENKKKQIYETSNDERNIPKLRSTLSARNLFSGGDLLNKVAEFCNELKKFATNKARDKENLSDNFPNVDENENLRVLKDKEKEKKPLLELSKEKSEVKGKLRRKIRDDDNAENTPISVNVKNIIKNCENGSLSQIRTSPPTPQCFSANRGPPLKATSTTPNKPLKPRPSPLQNQERGILQEVKATNKDAVMKVERENKTNNNGGVVAEKEARSLDVFWFLKPCTLST